NRGGVQRVVTGGDPQKTRALLEGLGPQTRYRTQLLAGTEGAVGVTVRHDVAGQRRGDARDPGQQRRGGGVDIHPHTVDTVLHNRVQGAGQLGFGQVVLVLTHTDRLGVDLDQFGERVLQTAGDGGRTA